MPDIQLRFQKDMLVLSAPVDATLARQGIDAQRDRQYLNLMEPDCLRDALALEVMAGAQCVVTTTEDITRARLAHVRMESDDARLAQAALDVAHEVTAQHILAEIGPCGLPLDASSKASLNENRAQYAHAARAFAGGAFDAYFLNGFTSLADLKCAIMGVMQVASIPVFASVVLGDAPDATALQSSLHGIRANAVGGSALNADDINPELPFGGYELVDDVQAPLINPSWRSCMKPELWPQALDVMIDLGVAVVGFETAAPLADALAYAQAATSRTQLPVMAQLRVVAPPSVQARKNLVPLADLDEYTPDTMANAAVKLYGAGVQFLRATGIATSAYTGSLAATVAGLDVRR